MKKKIPIKMRKNPNPDPIRAEIFVAQAKSFFHPHKMDRNIRPPSKGKAGIKLKITIAALIEAK